MALRRALAGDLLLHCNNISPRLRCSAMLSKRMRPTMVRFFASDLQPTMADEYTNKEIMFMELGAPLKHGQEPLTLQQYLEDSGRLLAELLPTAKDLSVQTRYFEQIVTLIWEDNPKQGVRILREFSELVARPAPAIFGKVAKLLYAKNHAEDALNIYTIMCARNILPTIPCFKGFLYIAAQTKAVGKSLALLEGMEAAGLEIDATSFHSVIRATIGHPRVFDIFQKYSAQLATANHYETMILACARQHKYSEALKYFLEMRHRDMHPSDRGLSSLLALCSPLKNYEWACNIFSLLNEKDVVTYNTFMNVCVETRNLDKAWEAFEELNTLNMSWDIDSFNVLLKGCMLNDEHSTALKMYDTIKSAGDKTHRAPSITSLISDPRLAAMVQGIYKFNIRVNIFTEYVMLHLAAKTKDQKQAMVHWESVKDLCQEQDIPKYAYICMLKVASACHDFQTAVSILQVKQKKGHRITEFEARLVLTACWHAIQEHKACANPSQEETIQEVLKQAVTVLGIMHHCKINYSQETQRLVTSLFFEQDTNVNAFLQSKARKLFSLLRPCSKFEGSTIEDYLNVLRRFGKDI